MSCAILISLIPITIILSIVILYNRIVRLNQHVKESWAGIDSELKRRYDLIPNLVETVRGYASHEKETLENVVAARNQAVSSTGAPSAQAGDENALIGSLRSLFVVVEKYPDLKANTQFQQLQKELANTETNISQARRFYNANVREFNTAVQTFPTSLFAKMFGYTEAQYFEIEEGARATPVVEV